MKRNPEKILNSLTQHSSDLEYKFERLYRILFNDEMYYIAYQRIYAKQGNMTKGVDGKTIDGFSIFHIERLIDALKDETYQPNPSQRVYIPKKNGKMRPLGIPSFIDKLLQEAIRMILEAIYEGSFENSSHGFRPQRSPQTALWNIQKRFNNTKWFIEGDIKGFFDNIDHEVLIAILSERISDVRFLRLIRKFLNAGYVEDWVFHKSYSGTPQGGIISPILANIYLDKFDKYIKEYTNIFDKGKRRKENPIVKRLGQKKAKLVQKLKKSTDEIERQRLMTQIKEIVKERLNYPASDEMDSNMKRLKYVRYADDFLIGIIGSKEDCIHIKEDIKKFMAEKLKLELSDEKTLITNARKHAKFLGYDIWKIQCKLPPKTKRFCPLKTFNNAPLKSLDRWGYYYFSLFPSVCSHFTDTFSCQLNPVRRMYNTIHNGICYCRVSDCIIPIVRWQLRGDDDGLAPMSVLYYIEQDGSFLGIKVHKEEVIQYEQRAPFDSLEFRFQCAFYFCHLKRTHKFRSIRIICPYALLAGFIPHCCGKEALPGTG